MLVLITTIASSVHGQEYASPMWGGGGGTGVYNLDCGPGGLMVGLFGKTGLWMDQVGIICQTIKSDGALGTTYTRGPVGGSGGTATTRRCSSGHAIGFLSVRSGSYIEGVYMQCYPWLASSRRLDFTNPEPQPAIGAPGGSSSQRLFCPGDKVGKALRGKSGQYIDSMQFVCDAYNQ